MAQIPVNNIARYGIVSDEPDHRQAPEAWTNALNVRFIDDKAVRFQGDFAVMSPASGPPSHVVNIQAAGGSYWMYAEAVGAGSKVYVYNSGAHSDITNGAGYTADNPQDWTSTIFQGVPILNTPNNTPQAWMTINPATPLVDLANWTTDMTCRSLRAFKNYLIALNTSEPGDTRPHRIVWSDSAEPGTLPTSWDTEDPAVDAGDFDLSDVNSGEIVDGMPLRDFFVVYKEESTWLLRHIGGQLIMGFDTALQTAGILAKRCATPITLPIQKVQVHFAHNGQDLGVFNGQDFESVIDRKVRKRLNADIDPVFYQTSFVVDNPASDEVWFCYPQNGMTSPNMALVWNYRRNTITFREFQGAHAATGVVEAANLITYDDLDSSVTYDNVGPLQYQDQSRRKLVIADNIEGELIQADIGETFNGRVYNSFVERTALAIIGQDREGNPTLDYTQRRMIKRVFPKVRGDPVNIYIGGCEKVGDDVVWLDPQVYDPAGSVRYVDFDPPLNTRLPAIRIEAIDGGDFSCEGYELDLEPLGEH